MAARIDLTEGSISDKLVKLALPIMATSFIQMAYNLTDMLLVGRVGTNAVAAIGTAGSFTMLATSLAMIPKVGAEVKVAQSLGKKDEDSAKGYIVSSLQINLILSLLYGLIVLIFAKQFIGFFKIQDLEIIHMSEMFLKAMAIAMPISCSLPIFTAIFNGAGNSRTPFIINAIGLVTNIALDIILINGLGPFPKMGVMGAAVATISAQSIGVLLFLRVILKSNEKYLRFNIFSKPNMEYIKDIFKLGIPAGCQHGLFSIFSILLGRIISSFGPTPIAVQKVGIQIEAISWMTAGGFSTALGAFVGQNYGAKKYDRIKQGYKVTIVIAVIVGVLTSLLLILGGEFIFSLFTPNDTNAIALGKDYLIILGYSQFFMCIEITTAGAFNGLGKTHIPAIMSIILTGMRVPAAMILSSNNLLGINGVWWSISMSSVLKGILLVSIFIYMIKSNRILKRDEEILKVIDC